MSALEKNKMEWEIRGPGRESGIGVSFKENNQKRTC